MEVDRVIRPRRLLTLAKVADNTHSWIRAQNQEEHSAAKAVSPKPGDVR